MRRFLIALLAFGVVLAIAAYVPVASRWRIVLLMAGTGPFLIICRTLLRAICSGIERLIPAGRVKRALTRPHCADQTVYEGWPLPVPRVKPHWLKASVGMAILAGVVVLLIADRLHGPR